MVRTVRYERQIPPELLVHALFKTEQAYPPIDASQVEFSEVLSSDDNWLQALNLERSRLELGNRNVEHFREAVQMPSSQHVRHLKSGGVLELSHVGDAVPFAQPEHEPMGRLELLELNLERWGPI